ncbi:MAG TPA: hypothetical protein VII63_05885 [Caulobacteraceae bacterium]
MTIRQILAICLPALAVSGCIANTLPENAALRVPWPPESPPQLLAFGPPDADYPSVGGDTLKGASPAEQEAARAAADRAFVAQKGGH